MEMTGIKRLCLCTSSMSKGFLYDITMYLKIIWMTESLEYLNAQKKGSHLLGSEDNHVITIIVSTGYKSLSFILHLAVTR